MGDALVVGLVAGNVGGIDFPVENAIILKEGLLGNMYSITLGKDLHEGLRPGEDPVQYERILSLESPRTSALSLYRFKVWWMRPCWGTNVPLETILLLDQPTGETGNYRLVVAVPLPVMLEKFSLAFASASLRGSASNIILCSNRPCTGLYSGEGQDPYELIREGVQFAASVWCDDDNSDNRQAHVYEKSPLCKTLGWCSWNAFYTNVTGLKVVDAIHKLKTEYGVPIRWMILDDGWQDTTTPHCSLNDGEQWSHRLKSIKEHPTKFADLSLRDTVQSLKTSCNIEAVLVWHTLAGYWLGLDENSFDVDLHFPKFPRGIVNNDWSVSREASVSKGVALPIDPSRFFQHYHEYLISCGVDGVKVDAQGVVGTLQSNQVKTSEASSAVLTSQSALAQSPIQKSDYGAGIIHCMAHAPEIFFRLPSLSRRQALAPLFRASDDFYPDHQASHGAQLVACAFNSLLFRNLVCPDYDMFSTKLMAGVNSVRMHAIARCLSGGPIYISDAPENLPNRDVISWLCCADGTTLPCRDSSVPIRRCLLHDPLNEGRPFVVCNTNGNSTSVTNGILGIFFISGSGDWDRSSLKYLPNKIAGVELEHTDISVKAGDVPSLSQMSTSRFLGTCFFSEYVTILNSLEETIELCLSQGQSESVTFLPLLKVGRLEIATLGIDGRINGAGAVLSIVSIDGSYMKLQVAGCGIFSMAVLPSGNAVSVSLNGNGAQFRNLGHDSESIKECRGKKRSLLELGFSLVEIDIPPGRNHHEVEINFE